MKKIQWRRIPKFPNYRISNTGIVKNIKTNKNLKSYFSAGRYMIELWNNGIMKRFILARLMLKLFTRVPPKFITVHIDGNKKNVSVKNLKRGTMTEAKLASKRFQGKLRGISFYPITNRYRAYLSLGKMKTKTIGYYVNKNEAIKAYFIAYKSIYKEKPFVLNKQLEK